MCFIWLDHVRERSWRTYFCKSPSKIRLINKGSSDLFSLLLLKFPRFKDLKILVGPVVTVFELFLPNKAVKVINDEYGNDPKQMACTYLIILIRNRLKEGTSVRVEQNQFDEQRTAWSYLSFNIKISKIQRFWYGRAPVKICSEDTPKVCLRWLWR